MHLSDLSVIALLLLVSMFASSSETALFSLDRLQLRRIRERFRPSYDRIRKLLAKPTRLLLLLLLLNECVNLFLSSLITEMLLPNSEDWIGAILVSIGVTLPLVLFFGEITPKVLAAKMNRLVAIFNSVPLLWLYRLLFPLLALLDWMIHLLLGKWIKGGKEPLAKASALFSEEDILMLTDEGLREGTVHSEEKGLIERVFEFGDSKAEEVMTPIHRAFSVSAAARVLDIVPDLRLQKYSRIPVYQKNKNKIVGILYLKDLLPLHRHPELENTEIKALMAPALFIHPDLKLSALFKKLKENKTHMAIAVNKAEQAVGVVTMEDVLERIFGAIADERDVQT